MGGPHHTRTRRLVVSHSLVWAFGQLCLLGSPPAACSHRRPLLFFTSRLIFLEPWNGSRQRGAWPGESDSAFLRCCMFYQCRFEWPLTQMKHFSLFHCMFLDLWQLQSYCYYYILSYYNDIGIQSKLEQPFCLTKPEINSLVSEVWHGLLKTFVVLGP